MSTASVTDGQPPDAVLESEPPNAVGKSDSMTRSVKSQWWSQTEMDEAKRIEKMTEALASMAPLPQSVKQVIDKMAPAIGQVGAAIEKAQPYIAQALVEAYKRYQRLPDKLVSSLYGFCICFFGGSYPASFAAIEAFQATGGHQMVAYLDDIGEQFKNVVELNKQDDLKDDDGDGVADVVAVKDPKLLAKRKLVLFLRAVDPDRLTWALAGLYSGYMGILVSLKIQFASTVALASSIGDNIRPLARKILAPVLLQTLSEDYHKWVNCLVKYGCKAVALILAWRIQKIISSVQTSIKGGAMLATNLYLFLREVGKVQKPIDQTIADDIAGLGFAVLGIYFQLVKGGGVPFPFNILMLPFGIVERILEWNVTWISVDQQTPPAIAN